MRVIGIDPGSRYTGYGIIERVGPKLRHVASGRINATKGESFADRLDLIYTGLATILEEYPCQEGAIESIFTARNAMSTIKLGQARGVALLAAKHQGLALAEFAPSEIKQAVTGSGRATKEVVTAMVKTILRIEGDLSEDAGDALALAICHLNTSSFLSRLKETP
ncbi:MAG: crossover junction endodeoxyribonuclease RuvC [bacterium]